MYKIADNSLGRWTVGTEFVPMFYQTTKKEFVPLQIKRLYYEIKNTKTKEPHSNGFVKA
jgi:hypothetical protein